MDDFFEAYFGESDGEEFIAIKPDLALKDNIKYEDSFRIFKVTKDGTQEELS